MRKEGYFVIDDYVDSRMLDSYSFFPFTINDKKYFFKRIGIPNDVYNELIAEEFAKDFEIPCAHYDLGSFHGFQGVISEDFINDKESLDGFNLMEEAFKEDQSKLNNCIRYNNLKFYKSFLDEDSFKDLIKVFIFDVFLGNCDRHESNIVFFKDDYGIYLAPLFDNEKILSDASIKHGFYRLSVDENDDLDAFFSDPLRYKNIFRKFILQYKKEELVKEKLWILSDSNIDSVLDRVEDRIEDNISDIKRDIVKKLLIENKYKIIKDL